MSYNVLRYFEQKKISISNIFYLTRQNSHTIITLSDGQRITTTIPIKEISLYLPKEDFVNISKGIVLRKNQIVHISDEGIYTMTDGSEFQGRKRNLSQHKQIRQALGLSENTSAEEKELPLELLDKCSILNDKRIDGKGCGEYYRLHMREPQFDAYKWNNWLYQKVIHPKSLIRII